MLNFGRLLVLLVVMGAFAACGAAAGGGVPGGVFVDQVRRTHGADGVVFTFRVKNDGNAALQQVSLGSYCLLQKPGAVAIPAHSMHEAKIEVNLHSDCRLLSSLTLGYRVPGGPSRRRAEFTFDYIPSGAPYVGVVGRGWNGLCGSGIRDDAAKVVGITISEGQAPAPGCYKAAARVAPDAAKSFTLQIDNVTRSDLNARTAFSVCIDGLATGRVSTGTTTLNLRTATGPWCEFGTEFITELSIPDTRTIVGIIAWNYVDPNTIRLNAEGAFGYCGVKINNEHVKFAKAGGC